MNKILILVIFFYVLVLLQTSFLVHFNISGIVLNLILITVILINFFAPHHFFGKGIRANEWYEKWWGVSAAFIGGFFLDIFSGNFFGFYILILLALSIFIKFILRKYLRIPNLNLKS